MNPNRRKTLLFSALGVIVLALVWPLWNSFNADYKRAQMQAKQAEMRLEQSLSLRESVLADRAARHSLERLVQARGANFDLYSFVNERLRKHNAQGNAKLTSKGAGGRSLQAVSLEFQGAHIRTVLQVLHSIYSGRNLVVLDRLHHMRPARSGFGIDCEITLVSPRT